MAVKVPAQIGELDEAWQALRESRFDLALVLTQR
jgi:hypothetical protein